MMTNTAHYKHIIQQHNSGVSIYKRNQICLNKLVYVVMALITVTTLP
jgi:hypothetical protein